MTLRTRIAAASGASVALAVLAAAIGLYAAVGSDLRGEVEEGLRARASALALPPIGPPGPRGGPGGPGAGEFPGSVQPAPFGGASGYVQFLAPDGQIQVPGGQGSSPARIPTTAGDRAIARRGSGSALSDRTVHGTKLRVLTEGIGARGAVMVARPLTEVESELRRLLEILAIVGAAGIALAAGLGALVARVALEPVRRFTTRTERLTAEGALQGASLDLSRRLHVEGRDELGRLADSFNRTLDALERSIASQRQLVADAGHELRTPIASLRANIQTLAEAERLPTAEQERLRADIVSELDELTALVADVVELARGAVPDGRAVDDVRLDAIVRAAVERAARRGGVRFEQRLEPAVVTGQAERIDRAVGNLLENARKWSPEGGLVEVRLRDGLLSVRDHGPGFDECDLPHVFDRFYRAAGLGARPGDRPPGRRILRGLRAGSQRPRRRGAARGQLRRARGRLPALARLPASHLTRPQSGGPRARLCARRPASPRPGRPPGCPLGPPARTGRWRAPTAPRQAGSGAAAPAYRVRCGLQLDRRVVQARSERREGLERRLRKRT